MAELAGDLSVLSEVQVHHVAALVVGTGGDVLAIGAHINEELVVQRVIVVELDQLGAHVVSGLGGVDGLGFAGRVDDHALPAARCVGLRQSHVPQACVQVVAGDDQVLLAWHEAGIRDVAQVLIECSHAFVGLDVVDVEFDRGAILEI